MDFGIDIDYAVLVKKILDFLGIELYWISDTKQICVLNAKSKDKEVVIAELYDGNHAILFNVKNYIEKSFMEKTFLENLGIIKTFRYGIDDNLDFTNECINPFFAFKSLEELSIQLDLLDCKRM